MMTEPLTPIAIQLARNPHGRLVLTLADGTVHEGVTPVRAFPIAAPGEGLSLIGPDGHELLWIDSLAQVEAAALQLIQEELEVREFVPTIEKIVAVSSFSTPSTWDVVTDRGAAQLVPEGPQLSLEGAVLLLQPAKAKLQLVTRDAALQVTATTHLTTPPLAKKSCSGSFKVSSRVKPRSSRRTSMLLPLVLASGRRQVMVLLRLSLLRR